MRESVEFLTHSQLMARGVSHVEEKNQNDLPDSFFLKPFQKESNSQAEPIVPRLVRFSQSCSF
jgi:hypothetical protein